jgi:glycosyltransferase involved in cell wall biosynthesis
MTINSNIVGIGLVVWNGEDRIGLLLQSLLNQSYNNFTIYILDNQSTDKTIEIINASVAGDSRIKLIIDSERRNVADAQRYVFDVYLSKHDFCMFVCDDDIYNPLYIETLMCKLINGNVDLAYSGYHRFDGVVKSYLPISNSFVYTQTSSSYNNAVKFLIDRNCVPLFFGIYKTSSLSNSMSYFKLFDNYGFNHENIMLFHFLLNNKVYCVDIDLFGYFEKERTILYKLRGYTFSSRGWKAVAYWFPHQFNFSLVILDVINSSKVITSDKKIILYFILFILYFKYTFFSFIIILINILIRNIKRL